MKCNSFEKMHRSLYAFFMLAVFLSFGVNYFGGDSVAHFNRAPAGNQVTHRPSWLPGSADSIHVPEECDPSRDSPLSEIDGILGSYLSSDSFTQPGKAASTRGEIQDVLNRIPSTDPCFSWVQSYYAYASVALYAWTPEARGLPLLPVVAELYDEGRLIPLTTDLRNDWGGLWSDPSKILGAYDCQTTLVYFDSTNSPYDLGAILTHEMEHLLRDKFSYWSHTDKVLNDVPAALLLDETLASLHSGFLELARLGSGRSIPDAQDFQLFSPNGHLADLWNRIRAKDPLFAQESFAEFIEHIIFPEVLGDSPKKYDWDAILNLVSQADFPAGGPDIDRSTTALLQWNAMDPNLISPLTSLQKTMAAPPKSPFGWKPSDGAFNMKADAAESYARTSRSAFVGRLRDRMKSISPGCEMIRNSVETSSESGNYIGRQLVAMPGNGGNGVKPGGNGVKPGGNGVKPGGNGVKPSIPLSPCIRTPEGF